jgi:hypothetical protein
MREKSVPSTPADIAVPFPTRTPVMLVEMVRTGFVAFVKLPAKPLEPATLNVLVAAQAGAPEVQMRCCPLEPPVREATAPEAPRMTGLFEIETTPVPESVEVATPPSVVRPEAWVKYASCGTAMEDVVAIS